MATGVLNTSRAIEVSVFIVRAFVEVRQMVAGLRGAGKVDLVFKRAS